MALLDDLATFLQTKGVGVVGTTVFKGFLPDAPDACVALVDSPGLPVVRTMASTGAAGILERPRVQVTARATTPQAARDKAMDALTALDWTQRVTLGTTRYYLIEALQRPPFLIQRDENDRFVYGFTVQIHKALST